MNIFYRAPCYHCGATLPGNETRRIDKVTSCPECGVKIALKTYTIYFKYLIDEDPKDFYTVEEDLEAHSYEEANKMAAIILETDYDAGGTLMPGHTTERFPGTMYI
jgi:DNA-directed RNA polymerase subunit RPC12/RpoP